MTINHAGRLGKDYFLSYMKLVMHARQYSAEEAKQYVFQNMFGMDSKSLGPVSYRSFLEAYQELLQCV
ncbi:hypothetical protein P6P90_15590 [Ectobacillus antri]|jgi:hypothetical protein|uniref:Uncharacterized protein n=1 Tax=Ectobacillus antri TaxID=2486280 RepID=A0ABT6H7L0_9BACI|nr:hypothetical protein [Ectobacillus antri]MDG4658238.1 hypothetical protein [Ectobacillus antri]MDG5755324.1 hypothetical protein [Ectobacillus antri]